MLIRFCSEAQSGNALFMSSSKHSDSIRLFRRSTDERHNLADKTSLPHSDPFSGNVYHTRHSEFNSECLASEVRPFEAAREILL